MDNWGANNGLGWANNDHFADQFTNDYAMSGNTGMAPSQYDNPFLNDMSRSGYDYHYSGNNQMDQFASMSYGQQQPRDMYQSPTCGGGGGAGHGGHFQQAAQGGHGVHGTAATQQAQGHDTDQKRVYYDDEDDEDDEDTSKLGWRKRYDWPSVAINILAIGGWMWMWSYFEFNKNNETPGNILFYGMIFAFLCSAFFSGNKTDKYDKELKQLGQLEKRLLLLAQVSLGMSVFITALRSYFSSIDPSKRSVIFTSFSISFILAFTGLLFMSFPKKNKYVRYFRKTKGALLNMSVGLMIFGMLITSQSLLRHRPTLSL